MVFTPTALGYRTGTLTVTNSATSPQVVNLSGNGISAVTVSPTTINFGSLVAGAASAAQSVILTNNQASTAVTISSIAVTGDFAQSETTCGSSLAGGASCSGPHTIPPQHFPPVVW